MELPDPFQRRVLQTDRVLAGLQGSIRGQVTHQGLQAIAHPSGRYLRGDPYIKAIRIVSAIRAPSHLSSTPVKEQKKAKSKKKRSSTK